MGEITLPTAAQALALAWKYASAMTASTADIARAEILLGIARELREEAQWRAMRRAGAERRLRAAGLAPPDPEGAELRELARRFREGSEPAPRAYLNAETWETAVSKGGGLETLAETALRDPGTTQRLPIVWSVGDKADCRHCHTPIEVIAPDPIQGLQALKTWQHKYTGQAACAVASMGSEDAGEPTHTFAEPEPRG